MRTSVVKAKLARDEPVLVVCLHFTDASLYEMTSLLGFDCIWMDLEHHGYSVETASQLMRAARVGGTRHRRPAGQGRVHAHVAPARDGRDRHHVPALRVGRGGRRGRQVVQVRPAGPARRRRGQPGHAVPDDARSPTTSAPPTSRRSSSCRSRTPRRRRGPTRSRRCRASMCCSSGRAISPSSAGSPARWITRPSPRPWGQISDAARKAGKHWGMPCFSVEHGQQLLDMGARFVAHGADIVLVKRGLEQIQQQFGAAGLRVPEEGRDRHDRAPRARRRRRLDRRAAPALLRRDRPRRGVAVRGQRAAPPRGRRARTRSAGCTRAWRRGWRRLSPTPSWWRRRRTCTCRWPCGASGPAVTS